MTDIKVRRKDVIDFADSTDKYWWGCEWCKHYQDLNVCSYCYGSGRFCFDWKSFYEEYKSEITDYIENVMIKINRIIYADNEEELKDYIKERYYDVDDDEIEILNFEYE